MIGVSRPFRLLSDAGAILDKHEALIQTPPIGDTGREFQAIRTELVQAGRALERKLDAYMEMARINTDFKLMALGLEDEKIALEQRVETLREALCSIAHGAHSGRAYANQILAETGEALAEATT